MAEIAVKSVLSVADIPRRDVRFDLIKLTVIIIISAHSQTKTGGRLGGHEADPGPRSRQGLQPPADAEDSEGRSHLPADLRVRAPEAEDEARGGDQVGQGGCVGVG